MRQMAALLFFALGCAFLFAQGNKAPNAQLSRDADSTYVPIHKFDSKRDAAADIRDAITQAQKTGQRILVDIGGDWCSYCREMDQFFQQHPDLAQLRDDNFITIAVFYSSENKNEKALSPYPKVDGIPHFFVLEKDGTVLRSEHVLELRAGGSYDPAKMKQFLTNWSPHPVVNNAKSEDASNHKAQKKE